jgi:hypothetical protein
MIQTDIEGLRRHVEAVGRRDGVRLVYLFGSQAGGEVGPSAMLTWGCCSRAGGADPCDRPCPFRRR